MPTREKRAAGATAADATVEACKLWLRPIMMTSLAFVLGLDAFALAVGAGAEMRRTLGIAVFSGILGVTLFGVFVTPVFYYVLEKLAREGPKTPAMPEAAHADHSAGDAAHVTRAELIKPKPD